MSPSMSPCSMYPSKVFLVRGNHEFRDMNESMGEDGFQAHVAARLPAAGGRVYEAVHRTFDWLPLGALVAGQVLVLHGGVGDGSWGLRELRQVRRPPFHHPPTTPPTHPHPPTPTHARTHAQA